MYCIPQRKHFHLVGSSPLLFGNPFPDGPKLPHNDQWRNRLHTDQETHYHYIPQSMLDRALKNAIATLPELTLPERQRLRSCIRAENRIILSRECLVEMYHVPLKALSNTQPYVRKAFPVFKEWEGTLTVKYCVACTSTAQISDIVEWCGTHVGLGVWRPQLGGTNGTFEVHL